jgi:hypothetical protein
MADSTNLSVFGQETYFNENVKFFKNIFTSGLEVSDFATFKGNVNFGEDVNFDKNITATSLLIREKLLVGDGGTTLNVDSNTGKVGIGSVEPEQKLDVSGSLKIDSQIYDSTNSPGVIGAFLTKDTQGIKWVEFEPSFTEGVFVYNDEVLVGVDSYRGLNFKTGRGSGINTDPIQAFSNPSNPNIADIFVYDFWEFVNGTNHIYRNSNVGINTTNPLVALDVFGSANITNNLNVDGTTTLNSTLDVDGSTTLNSNLDVDGDTTLNSTLDVDGSTTLNSTLNVVGITSIYNTTQSTTKDNGALVVEGGIGIEKNLNVGGNIVIDGAASLNSSLDVDGGTTLNSTLDVDGSTTLNSDLDVDGDTTLNSTLDVDGITTLNSDLDVDGDTTLNSTLDVDGNVTFNSTTQSDDKDTGAVIIQGGVGIQRNLNVGGDVRILGTLELESSLIDANNSTATGKFDYRLSSVGTGVSWRPPGVQTQNAIWVTMDGDDSNSGFLEGDAKRTIGGAAAVAQEGDTIFIRSGVYYENNPIGLRTDVSVSGQDLRLVTIVPNNPSKDVFHLRRGCLVENLNFAGSNISVVHSGAAVAFPPTNPADYAISGYIAPGPATEGTTGRWRSPYVRNCTNFMTGSIGMKIDGDHATGSTIGANLKSMVCDSFTQYNEAGIGVSITNNGYAQLVSIFTIACDIGIFAASGGSCDLTNSNSSFGNFGLVAVGLGSTEFTGKVNADTLPDLDSVVLKEVYDGTGAARRPYDGQALWFKINLDNYPDAIGSGVITAPLRELSSVTVLNGGSGFSALSPPSVLIRDADGTVQPKGPQGIIAEAVATVNDAGQITSIDVVSTGRNYLSSQNIVVDIDGNTSLAAAVMEPIYYTVSVSTQPTPAPAGITTVTFNEFIPYELFENDLIELRRISRILTSSHSFEYIGTGTDINTSTPLQGAVPIKANEVVTRDGAQIPFTSTDQKGNFDIGEGIQIDQTTSSIRGRDFSRAIQAEVTPLIIALK